MDFYLLFTMTAVMRSSVVASFSLPTKRSNRGQHHHQDKWHRPYHDKDYTVPPTINADLYNSYSSSSRRDMSLLRMAVQPNTIAQATTTTLPETVSKQRRNSAPKKQSQKGTEKMADTFATTATTTTQVAKKEIKKRKKRTKQSGEEEEPLYWRLDSDEVLFHPADNNILNEDKANISVTSTSSSSHDSTDVNTGSTILATPAPLPASWSLLRFTVRGNPVSLQRHRSTHNGRFSYNPSAPAQEAFRNVVQDILTSNNNNTKSTTTRRLLLLQPQDTALAVTLIFHRKRPLNHFMSSKRGPGRLKNTAPSFIGYSNASTRSTSNKHNDDDNDNNSRDDLYFLPHQRLTSSSVSIFQSDVDNLAKFVLDALNGFLYVDDKQIISLTAIKIWDNDDKCLGSTSVCLRVLKDQYELESFIRQQQNAETTTLA